MTKGLPRSLSRGPGQSVPVRRLRIRLNHNVSVFANAAAVGFGTTVVGDFPQGNIFVLGVAAYVQLAGAAADANIGATWAGNFSLGTDPTADLTLSGTEVNLIASTVSAAATAKVSPLTRAVNATAAMYDNTDDSLEVNLNVLVNAADIVDGATCILRATGYIDILYSVMLDD